MDPFAGWREPGGWLLGQTLAMDEGWGRDERFMFNWILVILVLLKSSKAYGSEPYKGYALYAPWTEDQFT